MILDARHRAEGVRIVSLAHQIEVMARQERLRDLDDYLKPFQRPQAGDGSDRVAEFLDRRIAQQDRETKRKGAE